MTDDITKLEDQVRDAAEQAGVDQSKVDRAMAESKSFLNRAQEALSEAVDNAVGAAKDHPIAAAGIAAGAAAAVAGAAYGAAKLKNGDTRTAKPGTRSKKKS